MLPAACWGGRCRWQRQNGRGAAEMAKSSTAVNGEGGGGGGRGRVGRGGGPATSRAGAPQRARHAPRRVRPGPARPSWATGRPPRYDGRKKRGVWQGSRAGDRRLKKLVPTQDTRKKNNESNALRPPSPQRQRVLAGRARRATSTQEQEALETLAVCTHQPLARRGQAGGGPRPSPWRPVPPATLASRCQKWRVPHRQTPRRKQTVPAKGQQPASKIEGGGREGARRDRAPWPHAL